MLNHSGFACSCIPTKNEYRGIALNEFFYFIQYVLLLGN